MKTSSALVLCLCGCRAGRFPWFFGFSGRPGHFIHTDVRPLALTGRVEAAGRSFPLISGCFGRLLRYPTVVIPIYIHIIVVIIIPSRAIVNTRAFPPLRPAVKTGHRANIQRFPLKSPTGSRRVRGEVEVPRVRRRVLHRLHVALEILL